MEILKTASDWAKAEAFSSTFFILFGILFVIASIGFWQLGRTDIAKAFTYPSLVAGALLLAIGLGLFFTNKARVSDFKTNFHSDAPAFVESEMIRVDRSLNEYRIIVFKIIPLIIVVAALLIIFIDKPIWRATSITTLGMMAVILLIDSNANDRLEAYKKQLLAVENHKRF